MQTNMTARTIAERVEHAESAKLSASELAAEMKALALILRKSMTELQALGAANIGAVEIPSATDELDAIVECTAAATATILDAVEEAEDVAAGLADSAAAEKLNDVATSIYQACSFQDLTGQRVTKIVDTLRTIDRRVAAICIAFGLSDAELAPEAPEPEDEDPEAGLLNGPGLPQNAMSQDEIDRILAGLD